MIKIILLALLVLLPGNSEARIMQERIYIIPAGDVNRKAADGIRTKLPESFPMAVKAAIDQPRDIPESAYDTTRKQYNARMVLDDIAGRTMIDVANERALVITDVDLYMPDSDFVYGHADPKKGICIISLVRMPDGERALKEAVHQLGVSWGLEKCTNSKCVMSPEMKRDTFCHDCRNKLHSRYGKPLINMNMKL